MIAKKTERSARALSDKQEKYAYAYADPTGDTFENGAKSAILAGYSPNGVDARVFMLRRNDRVLARIDQVRGELIKQKAKESSISLSLVRSEFQRLAMLCEAEGDRSNAIRCWEDLAKTIGAFTEGITLDIGKVREFADNERIEAKRIAAILLNGGDAKLLEANLVPSSGTVAVGVAKAEAIHAMASLGEPDPAKLEQPSDTPQPAKPSDSKELSNPEQGTPITPNRGGVSESIPPSSKYINSQSTPTVSSVSPDSSDKDGAK